jgi:rod shape-determining protein MreD
VTPETHWGRGAVVVALVFGIHEALLRGLRIDGVRPDILLGVGIVAAVIGGPEVGAIVAFALALLGDLFVNTPFGLSALVASTVAFLAGSVRFSLGTHTRWAVPILTVLGSVLGEVLWALIGTVLGLPSLLHPHLALIAGVVAAVNLVIAGPASVVMRWVFSPTAERSYAG